MIFHYNKKLEISFEKLYCKELKRRNKHHIINLRTKYRKLKKKIIKEEKYEYWIIYDSYN